MISSSFPFSFSVPIPLAILASACADGVLFCSHAIVILKQYTVVPMHKVWQQYLLSHMHIAHCIVVYLIVRPKGECMDSFSFYSPTEVVFGQNTVRAVGEHVSQHGVGSVLLVCGGGSIRHNGVYDTICTSLREAGVSWVEYWGVQPNPTLAQVEEGVQVALGAKVEGVLAVGGGSVMDCGKAIAAGYYLDDYWEQVETRKPVTQALPVFLVCTLSGTGSEMNPKAVITNEPEAKKWSLGGRCLHPKVAILDPSVQLNVPWHLTAGGGIDAMTHVMENYFAGRLANERTGYFHQESTLQLNEGLLRSLRKSLDELQEDPECYAARANLAWAACWGLNGLTMSGLGGGDWTSHALEHALSGMFPHIPHGEGLAVLFPSWMEQVAEHVPDVFVRFAREIWNEETIMGGIDATRRAFAEWGAPTCLSYWGVRVEHVPALVKNAFAYRDLGRIVPLDEDAVTAIFSRVL